LIQKIKKRLGKKKFLWSLNSYSSCGKIVAIAPSITFTFQAKLREKESNKEVYAMPIEYEFLANFYLCLTGQNSFQCLPKMEGKLISVNNVDKPLSLTK